MGCSKAKMEWWDKFIALNVYIRKEERSKMNNSGVHFKKLEKEKQCKP